MEVLQRLMARAFAGCLVAVVGALAGGLAGYIFAAIGNSPPPDVPDYDWLQRMPYFLHTLARTTVHVLAGMLLGGIAGFGLGALGFALLTNRLTPGHGTGNRNVS